MINRPIDKIIEEFFDENIPCPNEIPQCQNKRLAYKEELGKLGGGCTQCAKNSLKARFIEALWKDIASNFTSKVS